MILSVSNIATTFRYYRGGDVTMRVVAVVAALLLAGDQ